MVDVNNMDVGYTDFKELENSTVIHIRGLKLQLAVAYATLEAAKKGMKKTKKQEDKEEVHARVTLEAETCESTKTEDSDTDSTKK